MVLLSASVDPTNGWGNITRELCLTFYEEFREEIEFTLYLPKNEQKKDYVVNLPYKKKLKFILPNFSFSFRNLIKSLDYIGTRLGKNADLIHSLFCFPYALIGAKNSWFYRKPFLLGVQGTYGINPLFRFPDNFLLKTVYRKADKIIAPSEFTLNCIHNHAGIANEKLKVIHNGVNYERFQKRFDLSKIKENFGDKCKIILSVGGLKARKGFDISLKAFKEVKSQLPNSAYLIIGPGSAEKELKDLVSQLNLRDVHFVGSKQGNELVRYYQLCDVYIHTPVNINWNFEGFGIVYLEAGACGKPVIGSLSGGVSDAVKDGVTGILVQEKNVEQTAQAIIKLLTNEYLAQS